MTAVKEPTPKTASGDAVRSALDELALCYGIQPGYEDVWGNTNAVAAHTKLGLLRAMGVPCDSTDKQRQSLADFKAQHKRRLLEPVQVVIEHDPLLVRVKPRETSSGATLEWRLLEEHGAVHSGNSVIAELPKDSQNADGCVALSLDLEVPQGYHSLQVTVGKQFAVMSLIVSPRQCYLPEPLENGARWWGLAAQLYSVRNADEFGVGDFAALPGLLDLCADSGAALLGLSPLHAMFPSNPEHAGPYSPSSRLFLNTLFVDVMHCLDVQNSVGATALLKSASVQQRLEILRAQEFVDYSGVAALKQQILDAAFHDFRAATTSLRYAEFQRFCEAQGDTLLRHALYDALQEHFSRQNEEVYGWPVWPRAFQDPASAAVTQFAQLHADRVDYYRWLQWLADEQLAAAAQHARDRDLPIGLYLDIAVSVDRAGAETWANQHLYVLDAAVGAPPDLVNTSGQNWGLPPQNPVQLAESGYALFIDTLRRTMRHAGAIRIDHVMGLMRLYWVPEGVAADAGAYVHYPLQDLLGILALESQRNRCMVIGEDLGTVSSELVISLKQRAVLSYRLLYFEQTDGQFNAAEDYPSQALVAVSTHDLPTIEGWWQERDIQWRSKIDLYPRPEVEQQAIAERQHDRQQLRRVLTEAELAPADAPIEQAPVQQIHRFLARTPSMLQLVQLEDMLGLVEQANLPGTVDEHPNWRRRLPVSLRDFEENPIFRSIAQSVTEERRAQVEHGSVTSTAVCPRATYRLQLHHEFTFDAARAIVPYLDELGISHAYASPYLQSRAGSMHGYDIINHDNIDRDIGIPSAYNDWVAALQSRGMSHVLDIVPNHMGIMGADNGMWLDVLEHGQAARHAHYFDIDWDPPERALNGKVLLPVLGEFYGETLAQNDLRLQFDSLDGRLVVVYHEHVFRIDPRQYAFVLNYAVADVHHSTLMTDANAQELASISAAFAKLPRRTLTRSSAVLERYRDSELLRLRLLSLYQQAPPVAQAIESKIAAINSTSGLHELLERQAWRLAHWRTASDEINYRRFFDINDLAALRMEDEDVFAATHCRILELVENGAVTGLRIDHPDGLYDPAQYFRRLAEHCAAVRPAHAPPLYLVAEKILALEETLPADWQVAGTTGYEFASLVNGLFVDAKAAKSLTATYARFIGREIHFDDLIYQCKKLVMRRSLAAELRVLGNRLHRLAQADPFTRDFTRGNLVEALREIVACFPVYRSYICGDQISDQDRDYVRRAVADSKQRSSAADLSVFDFIQAVILQQRKGNAAYRSAMLDFAMKLQQFTAPVMAKSVEDTAFYRYYRLLSLNDVGDEPLRFGVSLDSFHRHNTLRLQHWPHNMLNSSSHDSKRSEDVRARLNVIAELPQEWRERVIRWRDLNRSLVETFEEGPAPSRNDEYFLYQTLLGSWPLEDMTDDDMQDYRSRIDAYMEKSVREGKLRSSWIAPSERYEKALRTFTAGLLDRSRSETFLEDFLNFKRRVADSGLLNSLGQTVLKLTVPGVPDIYQGTELWNFSLVDPDNRRPVDYTRREELLRQLGPAGSITPVKKLLGNFHTGMAKLYVIRQLLSLRQRHSALLEQGEYIVLTSRGAFANHVCAFARVQAEDCLIVVVPRFTVTLQDEESVMPLGDCWKDTVLQLPDSLTGLTEEVTNILTGECVALSAGLPLSKLLVTFPVAAFISMPLPVRKTRNRKK